MYSGGNVPRGFLPVSFVDKLQCPWRDKGSQHAHDKGPGCNGLQLRGRTLSGLSGENLNACYSKDAKDKKQLFLHKYFPAKSNTLQGLRKFAADYWRALWKQSRPTLVKTYGKNIPRSILMDLIDRFQKGIREGIPLQKLGQHPITKRPIWLYAGYCYISQEMTMKNGDRRTVKFPKMHGGRWRTTIIPSGTTPVNRQNQCQSMSWLDSRIRIYQDCRCLVPGMGVECANLKPEQFNVYKPKKGSIKATLYYNPATHDVKPVPLEKGVRPPTGYVPLNFKHLKSILSQHDKQGKKLILKFGAIRTYHDIFRATDETGDDLKFVIGIDLATYLAHYNTYNEAVHKTRVVGRIRLTPAAAKGLVAFINSKIKIPHNTALNQANFCLYPKSKLTDNGTTTYEYGFPNDLDVIKQVRKLFRKHKKIPGLSSAERKFILKKLDHWMRSEDDREAQNWQFWKGIIWQGVLTVAGTLLFGLLIAREQTAAAFKAMGRGIVALVKSPYTVPRWIYNYIKIKRKIRSEQVLTEQEQEWWRNWEAWKAQRKMSKDELLVRRISQDEMDQVELAKQKLLKNPDRIIIGLDKELGEYHDAIIRTRDANPALHGDSGSGKEMVPMAYAQRIAMARLWEDPKFQARVKANYGPEVVQAYERATVLIDTDKARSKKMYFPTLSGMQEKTDLRGKSSEITGAMDRTSRRGNAIIQLKEIRDMLRVGAAGTQGEGETGGEEFAPNLKRMLEGKGGNFGMDTLSPRMLWILRNPKYEDWLRRLVLIHVRTRSPKEVLAIMRSRYTLGELEDGYNVTFAKGSVEAATRLAIHYWGRSGPPINAARDVLIGTITHAIHKAKLAGNGTQGITITKEMVIDYLKEKRQRVFPANDPLGDRIGHDTMELPHTAFASEDGLRAAKDLAEGIRTGSIRVRVEEDHVNRFIDFTEDLRVRRLALAINAKDLDPKLMKMYETEQGQMEIAYRAVRYARRMLELLGDQDFGDDDRQWEAFVDNNLRKVTPVNWKDVGLISRIRSMGHWTLLQEMNPAKYDSPETMLKVGKFLAQSYKRYLAQWQANLHPEDFLRFKAGKIQPPSMAEFVEEYELFRPLGSNAIPGREYTPWIPNNEQLILAKAILANSESTGAHLEGWFGRFRREALRIVVERLIKFNEQNGYMYDIQDLVQDHLRDVWPVSLMELERAAQNLGITLTDDMRLAAMWQNLDQYGNNVDYLLEAVHNAVNDQSSENLYDKILTQRDILKPKYNPDPTPPSGGGGGQRPGQDAAPASATPRSANSERHASGNGDVARRKKGAPRANERRPTPASHDVLDPKIRRFRDRIISALEDAGYGKGVAKRRAATFILSLAGNKQRLSYLMRLPSGTLKSVVQTWARTNNDTLSMARSFNWRTNPALTRGRSERDRDRDRLDRIRGRRRGTSEGRPRGVNLLRAVTRRY